MILNNLCLHLNIFIKYIDKKFIGEFSRNSISILIKSKYAYQDCVITLILIIYFVIISANNLKCFNGRFDIHFLTFLRITSTVISNLIVVISISKLRESYLWEFHLTV